MQLAGKLESAKRTIELCATQKGFRASAERYAELWLRDLVFSEDVLLRQGYAALVRTHLEAIIARQKGDGQLPNFVTTTARDLVLGSFHSWTSDTEILFLIGSRKYANFTGDTDFLRKNDNRIELCLRYVEKNIDNRGFIPGCDWRDAVMNCDGESLLANQVLLLQMYELLGRRDKSGILRGQIRDEYYSEPAGFFSDFVTADVKHHGDRMRFDCLGNALAVLNDLLNPSEADAMASAFGRNRTRFGFRNVVPPYRIRRAEGLGSIRGLRAFVRSGAILRNRPNNYQNSAIWPFVESRIVRAFLKLGRVGDAKALAEKMLRRNGFNEWYSPLNGGPRGSPWQLWTAAAVIDAWDVIQAVGSG